MNTHESDIRSTALRRIEATMLRWNISVLRAWWQYTSLYHNQIHTHKMCNGKRMRVCECECVCVRARRNVYYIYMCCVMLSIVNTTNISSTRIIIYFFFAPCLSLFPITFFSLAHTLSLPIWLSLSVYFDKRFRVVTSRNYRLALSLVSIEWRILSITDDRTGKKTYALRVSRMILAVHTK